MQRLTLRLFLLPVLACITCTVVAQSLTPSEIIRINTTADSKQIDIELQEKGFIPNTRWDVEVTKERNETWYFSQSQQPGERIGSFIIKTVDSNSNARTTFVLYSSFHFKTFVQELSSAKFRFKGIKSIDNRNYFVFNRNGYSFLICESQSSLHQYFATILLYDDKTDRGEKSRGKPAL